MNFFDDDFGLGPMSGLNRKTSVTSVQKGISNFDQVSRKSGKKDEFDDLLDDLLTKEQKRNTKKNNKQHIQPYSSTNLEPNNINYTNDLKKTDKWSTPNIEPYASPNFQKNKKQTYEDRGSEDGKSYRSGFTGRQNQLQFDNLITLRGQSKQQAFVPERSSRNMMKPPIRKRQSKENITEQKQTSIWQEEQNVNFFNRGIQSTPNYKPPFLNFDNKPKERIQFNTFQKPKQEQIIRQKIIEKEKIITIREEATQLKKQFENQVRQIKQSYQRQVKTLTNKLKEQMQENQVKSSKLKKEHQSKLQQERLRSKKLLEQNNDRLKEMFDWQLKKKIQIYQMQIQKLKSINKLEDNLHKNQAKGQSQNESYQIKQRQQAINKQKERNLQEKNALEQRSRQFQYQERQFNNYKIKEQQKLQKERKKLLQKETQLKKAELSLKKNIMSQKQNLANELSMNELELIKKKQDFIVEREELRMLKQMFQKERFQFEELNRRILNDYKGKVKQVQQKKEDLHELQIELHKKLYTVELIGLEKKVFTKDRQMRQSRPESSNHENNRNRINTVVEGKYAETKNRFKEMEIFARKISDQTQQEKEKFRQKVNLAGYINRVNRALSRH